MLRPPQPRPPRPLRCPRTPPRSSLRPTTICHNAATAAGGVRTHRRVRSSKHDRTCLVVTRSVLLIIPLIVLSVANPAVRHLVPTYRISSIIRPLFVPSKPPVECRSVIIAEGRS